MNFKFFGRGGSPERSMPEPEPYSEEIKIHKLKTMIEEYRLNFASVMFEGGTKMTDVEAGLQREMLQKVKQQCQNLGAGTPQEILTLLKSQNVESLLAWELSVKIRDLD